MSNNNYEKRRALEEENKLLHAEEDNRRLKRAKLSDDTAELLLTCLGEFLRGEAFIETVPGPNIGSITSFVRAPAKSQPQS